MAAKNAKGDAKRPDFDTWMKAQRHESSRPCLTCGLPPKAHEEIEKAYEANMSGRARVTLEAMTQWLVDTYDFAGTPSALRLHCKKHLGHGWNSRA